MSNKDTGFGVFLRHVAFAACFLGISVPGSFAAAKPNIVFKVAPVTAKVAIAHVIRDGTGVELYNLSKDRKESENLAAEEEGTAARLKELALTWRKTLPN